MRYSFVESGEKAADEKGNERYNVWRHVVWVEGWVYICNGGAEEDHVPGHVGDEETKASERRGIEDSGLKCGKCKKKFAAERGRRGILVVYMKTSSEN